MDVLFLSPHYPAEMHDFTRGLGQVGARVWGVGDQPWNALPTKVRQHLFAWLQVPNLMNEDDVIARVAAWLRGRTPDRVEALWEPMVILAARLREHLGVPGMSVDTVTGFRDKGLMRERVAAAGLRVPHNGRAATVAELRAHVERIGFPVVIKPVAGAGSADTFKVESWGELDARLPTIRHVPEVMVEEYIDGEEYTYDAICIDGKPVYQSVTWYFPRPMIMRHEEWVSPAQFALRDLSTPEIQRGIGLGHGVLKALGMGTGFIHMEWFRNSRDEVVFGEIGCRSGGARLVDQMNFVGDVDLYREWARVVCHGRFEASTERLYNCAAIFKRAQGQGRILRYEGLDSFHQRYGRHICAEHLTPIGEPRRDWKNSLLGDGYVMVRHPDWGETWKMAGELIAGVRLIAG